MDARDMWIGDNDERKISESSETVGQALWEEGERKVCGCEKGGG